MRVWDDLVVVPANPAMCSQSSHPRPVPPALSLFPGAVWDLVRREDRPKLRKFFEDVLEGGWGG